MFFELYLFLAKCTASCSIELFNFLFVYFFACGNLYGNRLKVSATKLVPTVNAVIIHWHSISHTFFKKKG